MPQAKSGLGRKTLCPYCNSPSVMRRGRYPRQRYQCTNDKHPQGMSRYFYGEKSTAKVLLFDIETLPMEFYGWQLWDKITSPDFIIKDWCILSYSAKWLFQPAHMGAILTPEEAKARKDKRLVDRIWDLLNEADVVIAHNALGFDIPKCNARFVQNGMAPPTPYQTVDTLKTAQRAFGFSSNKLDYLGEYLGLGKKIHTEFQLWKDCAEGKREALDNMLTYNARDIYLLEDVYVKLRPWISHPNMALYVSTEKEVTICPRCGCDDLDWGETYTTTAGVYDAFRCNHCGSIGRSKDRKHTVKARVA